MIEASVMSTDPSEKQLSSWWRHAVILVMALGFSLLTLVTVLTYTNAPPIPERVTDAAGATLFTRENIEHGQEVFLKHGLMEHGTLWGHGAYLGPDYSAEYLHRLAEIARDALARERHGHPYAELDPDAASGVDAAVHRLLKENRYDPGTGALRFSAAEAAAWQTQKAEWAEYFSGKTPAPGLPAKYIRDRGELEDLTSYFAWAAWATVANRPGKEYSYTNNWPYEPAVGNRPSASTYLWSALSLVTLLAGLGTVLFAFGRFGYLGWHGPSSASGHVHDSALARWTLTPSQKAVGLDFGVVALLFLLQTLAGGALAHYRVESGAFYGIDLARILPYNLLRTFHLQLAIFWIATAWVAGGLFLAPIVGGAEPRGQRAGALALLVALAVVVFGSLGGEWLGLNDRLGTLWFWLGHQGSEYLDLGRQQELPEAAEVQVLRALVAEPEPKRTQAIVDAQPLAAEAPEDDDREGHKKREGARSLPARLGAADDRREEEAASNPRGGDPEDGELKVERPQQVVGEDPREVDPVEGAGLDTIVGEGAARQRLQQEQQGDHAEVEADRLLARSQGPAGEGAVVHVPARRRRAVPAEVAEAAESEQDGPEPREESHEAERAPEIGRGARPVAHGRFIGPVVGVGIVLAGAVGDGRPSRPREVRG